jgi:hypothetical protein
MPAELEFADRQTPAVVAAAGALRRDGRAGIGCPQAGPPHAAAPAAGPGPAAEQADLRAALTLCFRTFPEVRAFLARWERASESRRIS